MTSYTIGRARESAIVLADMTVSRAHAHLIDNGDGSYTVKDLGSSYGTFVNRNGEWAQIDEITLSDDTALRFGGMETSLSQLVDVIRQEMTQAIRAPQTTAPVQPSPAPQQPAPAQPAAAPAPAQPQQPAQPAPPQQPAPPSQPSPVQPSPAAQPSAQPPQPAQAMAAPAQPPAQPPKQPPKQRKKKQAAGPKPAPPSSPASPPNPVSPPNPASPKGAGPQQPKQHPQNPKPATPGMIFGLPKKWVFIGGGALLALIIVVILLVVLLGGKSSSPATTSSVPNPLELNTKCLQANPGKGQWCTCVTGVIVNGTSEQDRSLLARLIQDKRNASKISEIMKSLTKAERQKFLMKLVTISAQIKNKCQG